jgi:transcriptional regulator with XRE-family HTH domain
VVTEIVRLLSEERKRRKLSNYLVSKRCGVSQSMLSQVERGLRNPTLELILRIADGIGADFPAIIKRAVKTLSPSK